MRPMNSDEPAPLAGRWFRSKRTDFPAESNSGKKFFVSGPASARANLPGTNGSGPEPRGCFRTVTVAMMSCDRIAADYRNSGSPGGFRGGGMREHECNPIPLYSERANAFPF